MLDGYEVRPELSQLATKRRGSSRSLARVVTRLAVAVLLPALFIVGLPELLDDRPYDPDSSAWPHMVRRI
jgi:hypothetical protein